MGENGLTPLGVAVKEGRVDIIKYFMTKSNVNVTGKLVYTYYKVYRSG